MAFGREREAQALASLTAVRSAIAKDTAVAAQFEKLAASTDAKLDEIAALEAAGELAAADVDRRLAEVEKEAQRHRLAAEQKRRVIAKREQDIDRLERELARIPVDEKVAEHPRFAEKRSRLDADVASKLSALVKLVPQLEAARAAEKASLAAIEAARPAWLEVDLETPDAAEWPDVDELVAFLQRPPRSSRDAERAAKRSARDAESTRRATWSSAIRATSRDPVDDAALRRRGYDDELIAAVHAEHDRLVRVHAEREATLQPSRR